MENKKLLKKKKFITVIILLILVLAILTSNIFGRGWIFYHDGPYRGKVVDADTREPIEGAVVLGEWPLETYVGPAGPVQVYCDAQEAVTDKNGEFVVPRAFCFNLWPLTALEDVYFKIFKPGYDSYPVSLPIIGPRSTKEEEDEAQKYRMEYNVAIKKDKNNLIRLKRVKDEKERRWIHISFTYIPDKQVPKKAHKMLELINQERKTLGLKPEFIKE